MEKRGRALPEWFEDADPPGPHDFFYIESFWKLHTTRHFGMGVGPIPWDTIQKFGEIAGLEPDNLEAFHTIMTAMDSVWLDWYREEREAETERKKAERK